MNRQPINWAALLATIAVWIALFGMTLRTATSTPTGLVLKSLGVCLLIAFGGVMLWNAYIAYRRPN
jgi:hypothetical protein